MWDWRTYFIFGFSLVWAVIFLREYSRKPKKWLLAVFSLLPLFFLHAFRAETVGTDLPRYALHVEDGGWFLNNNGGLPPEILSELLYYFSHHWGGFYTFLFLTSLIEFAFLYVAICELNKKKLGIGMILVVIVSYVVLRSVSMVRNGIALSTALCAVAQFLDHNRSSQWKFWIFSLIAFGFHNSAIIMVPIYIICRPMSAQYSKRQRIITLRVAAIVAMFVFLYFIGSSGVLDLFFQVTGEYYDGEFQKREGWGIGNLAVRIPFFLFVLLSASEIKRTGVDHIPLLLMLLFDILVSQLKYVSQNFERLAMFTGLGEVVLWGVLYRAFVRKKSVAYIFFVIVGIGYFTYYMYKWAIMGANGAGNGLMPYHTWFPFL